MLSLIQHLLCLVIFEQEKDPDPSDDGQETKTFIRTIMKYRFLYFIWILPSYLAFIMMQQVSVYYGTIDTYNNGESIAADVTDFDIKQIAAQSNGYVVIEFIDPNGNKQERKLSLSIQMAQRVLDKQTIPIRYKFSSSQPVVMIPTYTLQKSTSLINLAVAFIAFVALVLASLGVTRFANKRARDGKEEFNIERIDL